MPAVDTRSQRNIVWGAFLASKGMSADSPISDVPTFYDEWEDYLFRSQNASALPTVPGSAIPIASPANPNARLGSAENPRVIPSRRGAY